MTQEEYNALTTEERKKNKWADLPRATRNIAALFIGLCIIGIGTCMFGGDDKPSNKSVSKQSVQQEVVFNSTWDGSVAQVNAYLKNTLNDPSSYEFVNSGPVIKGGLPNGATFGVRHQYRAKNAFGALILKDQVFYMDATGSIFKVEEYSGQ